MASITQRGKVKFFSSVTGYGFIVSEQREIFFSVAGLGQYWRPEAGDFVTFKLVTDTRSGRTYADRVRPADVSEVAVIQR